MASHDYEEFIAALNAHGVRYLVIGAHAVAFHARPRATKDLDILLEPTPAHNAFQPTSWTASLTSSARLLRYLLHVACNNFYTSTDV